MPTALVTGASRGLGRALTRELARRGWHVVIDARDEQAPLRVAGELPLAVPVAGDITQTLHREALAAAVDAFGGLDLLVNNASELGPSPMPGLAELSLAELRRIYETNVIAPLALVQHVLPSLVAAGGTVVDVSSDAAVEAYPGWGGYGSSKAALDHLTAVLAAEQPDVRAYAFDPGDMRTEMHQRAFPGEDISDRPEPETVVPALLRLVDQRPPGGRYRAADIAHSAPAGAGT